MIFSLHIPKTAGTSFFEVLKLNYNKVSPALKRKDIVLLQSNSSERKRFGDHEVVHGHFTYQEAVDLFGARPGEIIFWVRNPIDRVVSNFLFFKDGLLNPERNITNYRRNRHRKDESLIEYAEKEENRNRISKFIEQMDWKSAKFIGRVENYSKDLEHISEQLSWSLSTEYKLNVGKRNNYQLPAESFQALSYLNSRDVDLYGEIMEYKLRQ